MYSDTPAAKYMRELRLKRKMLDPATYSPAPVSGRWKPGESGNPAGRPRRLPLSEAQAALLVKMGGFGLSESQAQAQKRDKILTEAMYDLISKLSKSESQLLLKPSLEKMMRGDLSTLKGLAAAQVW